MGEPLLFRRYTRSPTLAPQMRRPFLSTKNGGFREVLVVLMERSPSRNSPITRASTISLIILNVKRSYRRWADAHQVAGL